MMPKLELETRIEGLFPYLVIIIQYLILVQGEDDKDTVTVGSLVTVKVTLKRSALLDMEQRKLEIAEGPQSAGASKKFTGGGAHDEKESQQNEEDDQSQQQPKRKVWEKPPKKKPKKGGKPAQKVLEKLIFSLTKFRLLECPKETSGIFKSPESSSVH